MTSGLPFDDFRVLLKTLRPVDGNAAEDARAAMRGAIKSAGTTGFAEDVVVWLAGWSGRSLPVVRRPVMAIFAGNHGVAAHGVSPRPQEATAEAVASCSAGEAAINRLCAANDFGLKVLDLALDLPTGDITREAAFDERAAAATMAFGMEAIAGGADLIGIGDFGVGNSTVAAAMAAALFGGKGRDWVDAGSGADEAMRARKATVIDRALAFHAGHFADPLEVLRRLGGREFAAIAGAIIAARMERIPIILGGFPALAAAAVLHKINPAALDHCRLSGLPGEAVQARLARDIGLKPLLAHDAGGGVGTALAMTVAVNAALCHPRA